MYKCATYKYFTWFATLVGWGLADATTHFYSDVLREAKVAIPPYLFLSSPHLYNSNIGPTDPKT